MSCWAASIRMILAYKGTAVASDDAIAAPTGHASSLSTGLNPSDGAPLRQWGFTMLAPQTFSEDGIVNLVNTKGPLWVACDVRFPGASRATPHVRVIRGIRDLQSPLALAVNDPGPVGVGSQYDETYTDFVRKNELLGSGEMSQPSPIYIAYCG
jgi:hypothetical protein